MARLKSALSAAALVLVVVANFLFRLFGMRDYMLFAGLGLAAYGVSFIYGPAAYILPGVALSAVAIFGVR